MPPLLAAGIYNPLHIRVVVARIMSEKIKFH